MRAVSKKLFFKRIQSIQNTSLREGVVCVCVGESFELQLVDGLQEVGVQRRQQRLVRREGAFEVRNVHRVSLKQKKVHRHCHEIEYICMLIVIKLHTHVRYICFIGIVTIVILKNINVLRVSLNKKCTVIVMKYF